MNSKHRVVLKYILLGPFALPEAELPISPQVYWAIAILFLAPEAERGFFQRSILPILALEM